jgi:hypothetical protein
LNEALRVGVDRSEGGLEEGASGGQACCREELVDCDWGGYEGECGGRWLLWVDRLRIACEWIFEVDFLCRYCVCI